MEPSEQGNGGGLPGRVKEAAAVAAKHAAAVDTEARFPAESFAAIKAQRLLGIMVPTELGGEGASDLPGGRRVLPAGAGLRFHRDDIRDAPDQDGLHTASQAR